MTRAIWYRHWLEIRIPVTIAGIAVAPLCLIVVTAALVPGGLPPDLDRPWAAGHIGLFSLVLAVSLVLGGTGVRTGMASRHPSQYYTLTLPAARFTLIWTRFVVGAAPTAALFTVLLAAGTAALLATGRSVPLGAMAATSVVAGLLAVALQAINVLLALWNEWLAYWACPAGVVALFMATSEYGWTPRTLSDMVLSGEAAPWGVAWILVLIVAASLSVAAVTARRQDF